MFTIRSMPRSTRHPYKTYLFDRSHTTFFGIIPHQLSSPNLFPPNNLVLDAPVSKLFAPVLWKCCVCVLGVKGCNEYAPRHIDSAWLSAPGSSRAHHGGTIVFHYCESERSRGQKPGLTLECRQWNIHYSSARGGGGRTDISGDVEMEVNRISDI